MQYVTTDNSLRRRWARVNEFFQSSQEKDFWVDTNQYLRRLVKGIIEVSLDEEMIQYMQTQPYQRAGANRLDYRNGYYFRNLDTTLGPVERITIPRSRRGLFRPSVFERYQRRQQAVNDVVCNVFLRGISTRDVAGALKPLLNPDGVFLSNGPGDPSAVDYDLPKPAEYLPLALLYQENTKETL